MVFWNLEKYLPEYHTEENKYFHDHEAKSIPCPKNRRIFSKDLVIKARQELSNGKKPKEIAKEFNIKEQNYSSFYRMLNKTYYKDI